MSWRPIDTALADYAMKTSVDFRNDGERRFWVSQFNQLLKKGVRPKAAKARATMALENYRTAMHVRSANG